MGYNYDVLLEEYLGHLRGVFETFIEVSAWHYGRNNVDSIGLPLLVDKLYKFVEKLYRSGRKHSRAVQAYYIFPELDREARQLLAAVDLYIAMLDEAYDENLTRQQKLIVLGAMVAIQPYVYKLARNRDVAEALARYMSMPIYVALAQQNQNISLVDWYYWRGSAMDFFMEVPTRLQGYREETVRAFIEAGRWMRAIILAWKDKRDVEHDREQGVENPFINQDIDATELARNLFDKLRIAVEPLEETYRRRILEVAKYYIRKVE